MFKRLFWFLGNERGAIGADGKEIPDGGDKGEFSKEQQIRVDAIVQDRLARNNAKFADYDDLRKFKDGHTKELEAATQKELEAKKEYDKLKEGWTNKEREYQGVITKKDSDISDMKISSALLSSITQQNAYAEEAMLLLKSQAVFDKEGNIRIKGRDANGLEVMDSVDEGVKKLLIQRPHLVKVAQKSGAGTGAGTTTSGAGAGAEDLNSLNAELMQASQRGDGKKIMELTTKIKAVLGAQGIHR